MKFSVLSLLLVLVSGDTCKCRTGDVQCSAGCDMVPNPSNRQAEKTIECNAACISSGGGDACFNGCVSQNYMVNLPSAGATSITGTTTKATPTDTTASETTPTEIAATSTSDLTKPNTSADDTGNSKDDKPTSKNSSKGTGASSIPGELSISDSHASSYPVVASVLAASLSIIPLI